MFRSPEFHFFDLLAPWNFGVGLLGFLFSWIVMTVLERTGVSRFIWHLPLFFLALLVFVTSVLGLFLHP